MLRVIHVGNCRPYGIVSTALSSLGKSTGYSVVSRSYRRPTNSQVKVSNSDGIPDFRSMTVKLLKEECRERKLKVSGRKLELIERLLNYEANRRNEPGFLSKQAGVRGDINADAGNIANGNPQNADQRHINSKMGSLHQDTTPSSIPIGRTSKPTIATNATTSHKPELNPVTNKPTPTSNKVSGKDVQPIKVDSTILKNDALETSKPAQTKQIDVTKPDANDERSKGGNTSSKLRGIVSTSAIFAGLVYWWSHDTRDTR